MMPNHTHEFTKVVRVKTRAVRKQCSCGRIGPWEVRYTEETINVPLDNPLQLNKLSFSELRGKAKEKGIKVPRGMTKAQLIEALTEVRVG